jgi:topoisomerase-4 subunit A
MAIKGRSSIGNILTKNAVRKITLKGEGVSTLSAREIWYDDTVNKLNVEQRGLSLGAFEPEDKILAVMKSGHYRIHSTDMSNHFDEDMILIEKFDEKKIFSAIYFDAEQNFYFVKRFSLDLTDKKQSFISEAEGSFLFDFTKDKYPMVEVDFQVKKANAKSNEIINVAEFIGVKSYKAKGKRLCEKPVITVKMLDPLPVPEDELEIIESVIEEEISEETVDMNSETDNLTQMEEIFVTEEITEPEEITPVDETETEIAPPAKKKSKKAPKPEEPKKSDDKEEDAGDGVQITLEF